MTKSVKIAAIIVAAGSGERFGSAVPKQYLPLMGKPVVNWSIDAFKNHPRITYVIVVTNPEHTHHFSGSVRTVEGGASRQQSVQKGLESLRALEPDIVLIHDAARPLVSAELITKICDAAQEVGAAIPGMPVTDTVRRKGKTENRDGLFTVQTPQGFRFVLIDQLHEKYQRHSFTDDAALYEEDGQEVRIVPGGYDNMKITHPEDIARAEKILCAQLGDIRTAQGYDVHQLVEPVSCAQKLMICGVPIPHDKVLEGHSDADVGLHAVTDALLGTICDGDIGQHFSPKDERWKNADSSKFLKHAAELLAAKGGVIAHVDVTLICEAPRIAPHRDAMRQRLADILDISLSRVSVKATTTEGLGFTGRREGIAAQSVITVRLPFRSDEKP